MRYLAVVCLLIFSSLAVAEVSPLPVSEAFHLKQVSVDNGKIVTSWKTEAGYYLYQERFRFDLLTPNVTIGDVEFPTTFTYKNYLDNKKMPAFSGSFQITLSPVLPHDSTKKLRLRVSYQGCSEQGVCYPQQQEIVVVTVDNVASTLSQQSRLTRLLAQKHYYFTFLVFLGLGILLSLTPCVLPMLPILSSIILGQKKVTYRRSFMLSLVYVMSIAISFAMFGVIAGMLGSNLQAWLQKPWIIGGFVIILVAMALSLFGFYPLQLPAKLRAYVTQLSAHQQRGSYFGVAVMGALSVLIASPCITPPLAAAIIYLGNQGNVIVSALALFFMGIGIGAPLLLIGAVGPRLLPKAGAWMNSIKYFFGVLMLGFAISMSARVLPAVVVMMLWGGLAASVGIAMGAFSTARDKRQRVIKSAGILFFMYGMVIMIGALLGGTDPLKPLRLTAGMTQPNKHLPFVRVHSLSELAAAREKAKQTQRPVMLDFYADWCVSCRQMDVTLFSNQQVATQLKNYVLIRADVTRNDAANRSLQRHFDIIAPPTILFFDASGAEIKNARLVGDISLKLFLAKIPAAR